MNSDEFLESPVKDTFDEDFISGIQSNETKKTLQDVVVPLRPADLFDPHFKSILEQNKGINLNIFILGYKCDQGIRSCGGRSGAERGPDRFRKMLYLNENNELCKLSKEKGVCIYDLGDICKY